MLWLKACPRCHGDMTPQSDIYGSYMLCIQCGAEFEEANIRKIPPPQLAFPALDPHQNRLAGHWWRRPPSRLRPEGGKDR